MHDMNPPPDIDSEITVDEQYTCSDCGHDTVMLYHADQCANCAFDVDERQNYSQNEITTQQSELHS